MFCFPEVEEKRTEDSEGDANQTAELCDADSVESSLPPDSRQKRLADLQAERAACDPNRLQGLKIRCERVVHSCIATLLLHLTQHQFTELEGQTTTVFSLFYIILIAADLDGDGKMECTT